MTELTLTKEKMIENLYLVSEEIMLRCMILNRRELVQAFVYMHPHVDVFDVSVMPANTVHRQGIERPDPLGMLDVRLKFYNHLSPEECREDYDKQMSEIETFTRYLDHLINLGERIETEIKEEPCHVEEA